MNGNELVDPDMMRALQPWFSGIMLGARSIVPDAPAVLEEPDHATVLAWRAGSGGPGEVVIMGPRTKARYFDDEPGRDCLQLRFRPGRAAEFLGLPLQDIVDRAVPSAELDSRSLRIIDRLSSRAGSPASHRAQLRSLARALPPASSARDRREPIVARATAMLAAGERVGIVARRLNVSERHLRTVFADGMGLAPGQFVRIDRVRLVLARIGQKLPDLAAHAGYYDQSHMGADFRRVMGATPHAFAMRRWPSTEICSAQTRPGHATAA